MMRNLTCACAIGLASAAAASPLFFAGAKPLAGSDYWAGIPRHPAVVNPVVGPAPADVLSLRGEWLFATNREPWYRVERACRHFDKWEKRTVRVPGCWEADGVGEPGMGTPHLCLDNAPKPVRHKLLGGGWYVKDVVVPAAWKGRRIWLKTGGARAAAWFLWDSNAVARVHNFCGTYKYDVTPFVRFGETNRVIVMVSNLIAPRNCQMNNVNRWGGLWRDVELEATPADVWIDDAWVRGDFDAKTAEVNVETGGEVARRRGGEAVRATVEGETCCRTLAVSAADGRHAHNNKFSVPLRNFRPWSPEHPNLYTAKVELVSADGTVLQTRCERFGVRKLEVRRREFYLNGRPFFVRGFGDDSVYPITGLSPADRDYHLKHLRIARAAGFNFVRLHTHCEIPEYFEAADEAGILVEPELSYYMDYPEEDFEYDPLRDYRELHEHYRRHPSFAVYSGGNEGVIGPAVGAIAYRMLKALDPDRLVIEQDGGTHNGKWGRPPYDPAKSDYCSGPLSVWQRGSFNARAFVAHEYLNLSVKSDSRWERDFTGLWMPPVPRAKRAAWLARFGLGHDWGDRFQDSAHALQKFWQKQGLEAARMDPYCDGYIYWTIADVTVYNPECETYAAQGWLDPFWRVKNCGATPADLAAFNSPDCLLLDTADKARTFVGDHNPTTHAGWKTAGAVEEMNRVYEAGETIPAEFLFAHYGDRDFGNPTLRWRLRTGETTLASGERTVGRCSAGPVRSLGKCPIVVPPLERPVRASLVGEIVEGDRSVRNSWDFWLFPKRRVRRVSGVAASEKIRAALAPWFEGLLPCGDAGARVAIVETGSAEEKAALARGLSVVSLANQTGRSNVFLGWWSIGAQVGTGFRDHPILKGLPCDSVLTPLWFRLMKEGTRLPVADVPARDLVIAGEGGDACYLYLSDSVRADGARTVRVSGLDLLSGLPEGNFLLASILSHCVRGVCLPSANCKLPTTD